METLVTQKWELRDRSPPKQLIIWKIPLASERGNGKGLEKEPNGQHSLKY